MKTDRRSSEIAGPKLPRPLPSTIEGTVRGLGLISRLPSKRAIRRAEGKLAPILLAEGESSGLPPDPSEPPPLPDSRRDG